MCVALEWLDKFVELFTSFTIQYHNLILDQRDYVSDALMKCTLELRITLCVKCTRGHLKLFNYLVNYSQHHLVL